VSPEAAIKVERARRGGKEWLGENRGSGFQTEPGILSASMSGGGQVGYTWLLHQYRDDYRKGLTGCRQCATHGRGFQYEGSSPGSKSGLLEADRSPHVSRPMLRARALGRGAPPINGYVGKSNGHIGGGEQNQVAGRNVQRNQRSVELCGLEARKRGAGGRLPQGEGREK